MFIYSNGDCGSGKTHQKIKRVKVSANRTIFVHQSLELVEQTEKSFDGKALSITTNNSSNVEQALHKFLLNPTHQVLVITSKSFFKVQDLTLFKQWDEIVLDDVTSFHTAMKINDTGEKGIIENHIFSTIKPFVPGYNLIEFHNEYTDSTYKAIYDQNYSDLSIYDYKLMNSAFFNKKLVEGVMQYDIKTNHVQIMAWIDLMKYKGLNLTFMANNFTDSLIYKGNPELFVERPIAGLRERVVPLQDRIKVKYFSKNFRLTRRFRKEHLEEWVKVIDYINDNVKVPYIYVLNKKVQEKLNGTKVKCDCRGVNEYSDYECAVWLTSLKPTPAEAKQLRTIFNITTHEINKSREAEYLYQFVNRTNLRDYNSTKEVVVYVFDEEQAKSLSTNIEYIDVGIDELAKFEALNMGNTKTTRLKRQLQKNQTTEEFEEWLENETNEDLTERERVHFVKQHAKKAEVNSPSNPK